MKKLVTVLALFSLITLFCVGCQSQKDCKDCCKPNEQKCADCCKDKCDVNLHPIGEPTQDPLSPKWDRKCYCACKCMEKCRCTGDCCRQVRCCKGKCDKKHKIGDEEKDKKDVPLPLKPPVIKHVGKVTALDNGKGQIMLTKEGQFYSLDFQIAPKLEENARKLVNTGKRVMVLGSWEATPKLPIAGVILVRELTEIITQN